MNSNENEVDNCIRKRVTIDGDNYYLVVGEDFVTAVCPRENDPFMSKERTIIETLCKEITKIMEKDSE